jgi:hypothetical protein
VAAAMADVEFSVVKVAACNLSSVGAPSTLSKAIRGLQTISTLLQDEFIKEVEAEFLGGQGPNFRELGEWGRLPCQREPFCCMWLKTNSLIYRKLCSCSRDINFKNQRKVSS